MASAWQEVQRLAADFQRAQLCVNVQRLSERNCVEIVRKLVSLNYIDVIFTLDGKEYVTHGQLQREIGDELYSHRGRATISKIAQALKADHSVIAAKCQEFARQSKSAAHVVQDQLLSSDYLDVVAEEINEKLKHAGVINLYAVSKSYDLPVDFVQKFVSERLGKIIEGKCDPDEPRVIYTEAYISKHRARLRGALAAVTRPVAVTTIINLCDLQERLALNMVEQLVSGRELGGSLTGGGSDIRRYVPDVYSKAQSNWVNSFYKQNGYFDYDALSRLDISDPVGYIKGYFKQEHLTFLRRCAVGTAMVDRVEGALDEAISSMSWVDVATHLPTSVETEDVEKLIGAVMKNRGKETASSMHSFGKTVLVSDAFLQEIIKSFDESMNVKARQDVAKGNPWLAAATTSTSAPKAAETSRKAKKDDRRKKATTGGRAGGGTQGRETKTKSVKSKHKSRGGDDSEDDDHWSSTRETELIFMDIEEIAHFLSSLEALQDFPEECLTQLAEHIERPLTRKYQQVVKASFSAVQTSEAPSKKKTFEEAQEKVSSLLSSIQLYQKGIEVFAEDVQQQLTKYLLRTLCTDAVNVLLVYAAGENAVTVDEETNWTNETRTKLLARLPNAMKVPLTKLNESLIGKSVSEFLARAEAAAGAEVCGMMIKKMDRKKERQSAQKHKEALLGQLMATDDPALGLHISALLLFQEVSRGLMLHASGKFAPQIITYLESHLPQETFRLLYDYQGLVIESLSAEAASEGDVEQDPEVVQRLQVVKDSLIKDLEVIKNVVSQFRSKGPRSD